MNEVTKNVRCKAAKRYPYMECDIGAIWGSDAQEAISHPRINECVVATDIGRWVKFTRAIVNGKVRYAAEDMGPIMVAVPRKPR